MAYTSILNQKLNHNALTGIEGIQEKAKIQEYFKTTFGAKLNSDQSKLLAQQLDEVDLKVQSKLLDIEAREWGQNVSISSSESPKQVAYGFCRLGGIRSFVTADQGETGEFLHVFITYAGHSIEKVQDLYLDGVKVDFGSGVLGDGARAFGWSVGDTWPNIVFMSGNVSRGREGQSGNSDLVGQSAALFPGLWTPNHKQKGQAGIYLIMYYLAERFPNGFPEIAIEGYWKNDIYDPRTGIIGYSNNSALCLANYLLDSKFGPGFTLDDLDLPSLIIAANVCDQDITLASGGTEKRYTTNGVFDASSSNNHQRVIEDLKRAMAGDCVYSGGKWYFFAGAHSESVITLDESHLRSDISVQAKPSKSDIFNAVQGKFQSEETKWEVTDYPIVKNSFYANEDGQEIIQDFDLPFTTSGSRAQRVAKIILESHRQWLTISATFSFEAYQVRPGDVITLNFERFGFSNKLFRVLGYDYKIKDGSPIVEIGLLLKETASAVYDWSAEETTIDLAPNTNLPDPSFVRPVTGLTLFSGTDQLDIRADGTVFSRIKATWDLSTDIYVQTGGWHEIEYKKSSDVDWRPAGNCSGLQNSFWILDIQDGVSYDVRVRAKTTLGTSAYTYKYNFFAVGKLENPTAPSSFSASLLAKGILLTWSPISDIDLSVYEIRLGASWGTATRIETTNATSFLYQTMVAGTHTFWIASKDTSGNYSDKRSRVVVIASPGPIKNLNALAVYQMVRLDWEEPDQIYFPVDHYEIYRGDEFVGATKIGEIKATVYPHQEQTGGNFTYWIVAVDAYGNIGTPTSIFVNVQSMPFFELLFDRVLSSPVLTDMVQELNGDVSGPQDSAQTWNSLFTARSWTTWGDKISAGYPVWGAPSDTVGQVEYTVDYGEVLSGASIVAIVESSWVSGNGAVDVEIGHSLDGSSWTTLSGSQVYVTNFRHVRVTLTITPDDDESYVTIKSPRLILEVAKRRKSGTIAAVSTDALGTLITNPADLLDVIEGSIQLTYQGSNAYFPASTISGNNIKVFLWNTSGARVSGDVNYDFEYVGIR